MNLNEMKQERTNRNTSVTKMLEELVFPLLSICANNWAALSPIFITDMQQHTEAETLVALCMMIT